MRENLNAIKRLVAFFLTVFLIGTTVGNDVFVIATEENRCPEFVDEQTYAANVLQPIGEGDGYCDRCGQVEEAHIQFDDELEEDNLADEEYLEEGEENIEDIDNTTDTQETQVSSGDAQATDSPEYIDETDETSEENKEDAAVDTDNSETGEEEIKEDEETTTIDEEDIDKEKDTEEIESEENKDEEEKDKEDLEEDKEKEEECEHQWEYIANGDGTHMKRCERCEEEEREACDYGDDGLCKYCGAPNMELEYQSYSKTFGSTTVTVAGNMPSHSTVTIYRVSPKSFENLVNRNLEDETFIAYEAFDIDIWDASGNKYQPNDNGESVQVSFKGVDELQATNEEDVTVFRLEDDNTVTEVEKDVVGEDVYFEADHFTIYGTGTVAPGSFLILYPTMIDGFGYAKVNNTNADKPYLKVNSARFKLYVDMVGQYTFSATTYKNLTDASVLDSGTAVATTGDIYVVNADTIGWMDIEIPLSGISGQDRFVTYGNTYSVVVIPMATPSGYVNIGYGTGTIESYVKSGTWEQQQAGIFIETDSNIELSATASDTYTITSISGPDPSSALGAGSGLNPYKLDPTADKYLYSKGDSGTFKATLSNTAADRNITWTSSDSNVIEVNASTGAFKVKAGGIATVTARYQNSSTTSTKAIDIKAIQFTIGGVDPDDSQAPYKAPYSGVEQSPTVRGYVGSTASDGNEVEVKHTFGNNLNVTTEAQALISYTVEEKTFTFNRYFTINPIELKASAFTNDTTLTVANGAVTAIDNVDPDNTEYTAKTRPKFGTDFTASIVSTDTSINGKVYVVDLVGKGNFTNPVNSEGQTEAVRWTKTTTSEAEVGITVELTDNSKLNACYYTGEEIGLSDDWSTDVVFKDSEGNTIDFINKSNATYLITDKGGSTKSNVTAGEKTLTFTVNSNVGGLAGAKFSVDFWVLKADISKAEIVWTNGNEFSYDGNDKKPEKGTHFTVKFGTKELSTSEYDVTYTGDTKNVTGTTNIPTLVVKGAGTNFDAKTQISAQYKIVADYDYNLIVRIQVGNSSYDGTKENNYVIPYEKIYNGVATSPNIIVYMDGTIYEEGAAKDYTVSVSDEGESGDATANVGTKVITITPTATGAFKGKLPVTATYKVVQRSLTTNMVDISKVTAKTYRGSAIDMVTAEPKASNPKEATSDSYDVKVTYDGNILKRGTDYTLTCEDNTNAGTATFYIEGTGNFKGKLSSGNYKFTINPAELSKTDTGKAYVTLDKDSVVYNGSSQEPTVTVKVNGKEINRVDATDSTKVNYTIDYADNLSVGTASVTVKGSNNLKGTVVLNFTITSDKSEFSKITIKSDYKAEKVKISGEYESTAEDGTITRYYTCNVPITYSGTAFDGSVGVYVDGNNKKLEFGKDYRYAYVNVINAKNCDITSESGRNESPKLIIYGQGSYKNNNAEIYLNVSPIDISTDNTSIKFDPTEDDNFEKQWNGSEKLLSNLVIKIDGKTLTAGEAAGTTGDYYITYLDDKKSAGTQRVKVTGRGNYGGARELTYQIGQDISSAIVTIVGPHLESDEMLKKSTNTSLLSLSENHGTEETPLTDIVNWRGNNEAPRIRLYGKLADSTLTLLTAKSGGLTVYDYTIEMSTEFSDYRSRQAGDETGTNFNTVHVKIDADAGTSGYYGKAEFYFDIYPQSIKVLGSQDNLDSTIGIISTGTVRHPYTGNVQTITPELKFYNGGGVAFSYALNIEKDANGNDVSVSRDYEPVTYDIGPSISDTIQTAVTGKGNFTDRLTLSNIISKGNVKIYRTENKLSEHKTELVGTTAITDDTAVEQRTTTYNLSDENPKKDYYLRYTYTGQPQFPTITLTSIESDATNDPVTLNAGVDYIIQMTNDDPNNPEDLACVGTKTITIVLTETKIRIIRHRP